MKIVSAAKFSAQCLAFLDSIDSDGIVITKHGEPIAKLIPIKPTLTQLIGRFKGKIKIKNRIFSTGVKWHSKIRHGK